MGSIRGIGVDLVEIGRMRHFVERQGERGLRRLFTEEEIRYCKRRANPYPSLAARFAAKEAALKALGTGWTRGLGFRQVEVVRRPRSAPTLVLTGRAAERARELGVTRTHLSLSHTSQHAIAQVVLEGD